MALPNWWQVTTPHKDIQEGKLNEAIFAADLGDVAYGNAPLEYQDAGIFFHKTYVTKGLKKLLENVHNRLSQGKGDSVIQLQTPFGGGKTHALLLLYHLIKNRKQLEHIAIASEFPEIENAKVAVFVGTHADALQGKTPWGQIAHQLGQYDIIKEHDINFISPGKEKLKQIFDASGPTLILMDELLEYVVKAHRAEQVKNITHGQTLAFLQELSEVVAASPNCCLVLTLPASILEQYDEEAERSLQQLQKISGRVETVYTPVEGIELYEVVRTRLFEDFGDEKTRKEVAQSYFDLYQKSGTDVPSEVKEIEYRERIEHAYPFHPELIDVLYERWGSYSTFQRTRGVLRLLAEVVLDLYKRKVSCPLIQSCLVNLENQAIRREFIKHIGNQYDSVISSDIAGKNAKAPKIDKEMGSEYEKYGIACGIATSVFVYSFSGSARTETSLPRIRVALLREGIPPTIVGDAVSKLEEELWYFHSEKKQYSFKTQPNLNRVIVDKEETINEIRIEEELKEILQRQVNKAFDMYIWPENTSDIPDNKNLKLAILSPYYLYDTDKGKKLAQELFEKSGNSFRVYKNTLFIIAMDSLQYTMLSRSLKHCLALKDLNDEESIAKELTKESKGELKKKLDEANKAIPFKILNAYRYLALMEAGGVSWKDMGIPTIGVSETILERVKQYLKDQERILYHLTPKYILDKTFGQNENEKVVSEIYDLFLKTPGMPIPESYEVLLNAVQSGIKDGFFGVKEGDAVYYLEHVNPSKDSVVLRSDVAKKIKDEKKITENDKQQKDEDKGEVPAITGEKDAAQKVDSAPVASIKSLRLKAKVPWDKLSYIIGGVVAPLKKDNIPEITIEIKAHSDEGFDRNTIENKVRETLKQIGAHIEDWDEAP